MWKRSEPGHSLSWGLKPFKDRLLSLTLVYVRTTDAERGRQWLLEVWSLADLHFCLVPFTKDENPALASSVPQNFAGWYRQAVRPLALHTAWPNSKWVFGKQGWVWTVSRQTAFAAEFICSDCTGYCLYSLHKQPPAVPQVVLVIKRDFQLFFLPCSSPNTSILMQPQSNLLESERPQRRWQGHITSCTAVPA